MNTVRDICTLKEEHSNTETSKYSKKRNIHRHTHSARETHRMLERHTRTNKSSRDTHVCTHTHSARETQTHP